MKPRRKPLAEAISLMINLPRPMPKHQNVQLTDAIDRPTDQPAANDDLAPWDVAEQLLAAGARSVEAGGGKGQQTAGKVDFSNAPRAGEAEADQEDADVVGDKVLTMDGTSLEERQISRKTLELRRLVGDRLKFARETYGLNQVAFAAAIGHRTSAQPSQWEKGHRLPPVLEFPTIARALGCSVDYLLGVSESMEHDVGEARRAQLIGALRTQLEAVASNLADTALVSGVEVEAAMRSTRLLSRCGAMASAVQRFKAANAEAFDDFPAGALLVRAVGELAEAAAAVGVALDGVVMRRERAALQAKAAMSGGVN